MTLLIKNALVLDGGKRDILCEKGKIKFIFDNIKGNFERIIDASSFIALPGAIDCHIHMREPGFQYKEDFLTGSRAAAKGGITTVLVMPNTNPQISTVKALAEERRLAKKSIVNYGFYFVGTDESLAEIGKVQNIAAVKIFMDVSTGNLKVSNDAILKKLFSSFKRIAVHAEGNNVIKAIQLIKSTKNKLYLCHISSAEEIGIIQNNKIKNKIFVEVTPHHLFLTIEDENKLKGFGMMKPNLKSKSDQDALWRAIDNGLVDTIASDHAPHTIEEKSSKQIPWGVPGLETMLPLLLDAVNKGKIKLKKVVELISSNPAKIFGIKDKGVLKVGYDADIILVDMSLEKEVRNDELATKCKWSPFNGKKLKGWPVITIVNGNVVYAYDRFFDSKGEEIRLRT